MQVLNHTMGIFEKNLDHIAGCNEIADGKGDQVYADRSYGASVLWI